MTSEDFIKYCQKTGFLKGHRLKMLEHFCANGGKLSYRDIGKLMSTVNCVHMDLIKDLEEWGVIKQIGFALHKESGAKTPVWELTGKPPVIPGLVDYKDVVE
jgi:hypothetical protein